MPGRTGTDADKLTRGRFSHHRHCAAIASPFPVGLVNVHASSRLMAAPRATPPASNHPDGTSDGSTTAARSSVWPRPTGVYSSRDAEAAGRSSSRRRPSASAVRRQHAARREADGIRHDAALRAREPIDPHEIQHGLADVIPRVERGVGLVQQIAARRERPPGVRVGRIERRGLERRRLGAMKIGLQQLHSSELGQRRRRFRAGRVSRSQPGDGSVEGMVRRQRDALGHERGAGCWRSDVGIGTRRRIDTAVRREHQQHQAIRRSPLPIECRAADRSERRLRRIVKDDAFVGPGNDDDVVQS